MPEDKGIYLVKVSETDDTKIVLMRFLVLFIKF